MSIFYEYDQDDFKASLIVDPGDLNAQILGLNLASATIQYINMNGDGNNFTVEIYFNQSLSVEDKTTLDNYIAIYEYHLYDNYFAIVRDIKSIGTNGGTFTAGLWVTRELTDIEGNQNFCALNNDQITIYPGLYTISVSATACGVQNHQMRLYNVTNNTTTAVSNNGFCSTTENDVVKIDQYLKLNAITTFEIQHQCSQTSETNIGFGRASGFGESEVYIVCTIVPQNPAVQ